MGIFELFLIAVGLSMDAFAIAVCKGLAMPKATWAKACVVGLYFGVSQAVMPLIGYLAASSFADYIAAYDHWVAFILLCFLGGKMAAGSFKKGEETEESSLSPKQMLPMAVATSVDALAVGISLAFIPPSGGIIFAVLLIGVVTFTLSVSGVKIGKVFGAKFKSKAEFAGGVILILIGCKILLEHIVLS